jgi:hypothetical protein
MTAGFAVIRRNIYATQLRGALVIVLTSAVCATLFAQSDRGTIRGVVRDTSGAVVPNAAVAVVNIGTNSEYKTISNASTGDFTAPGLPTGNYRVRVESSGFKSLVQEPVAVLAGDTVSLDIKLEVGATQETVEVTSDAPLIQTDTARVATQVSNKFVEELPLAVNGAVRSPFDLAGVTGDTTYAVGGTQMRIGGGKAGYFGMTLEGTPVTVVFSGGGNQTFTTVNSPSVEAIAEFAVDSNAFKAEFGHASGGSVSFVAKSGTNQLHGSAYEFLRNTVLGARGFFAAKTPTLKQNDFGATLGGPVIIPKIYNGKNRTFFFFSYEGFRNRAGALPTPYSVPPPDLLNGNFSNWVNGSGQRYTIYDPMTTSFNATTGTYSRQAFTGNIVPTSRIDPVAQSIIAFAAPLIVPNAPGLVPGTSAYVRNNYINSVGTSQAPSDKTSIKADQLLTSNQRISFYYGKGSLFGQYGPSGTTGLPEPLSGTTSYSRSGIYRGSHDYTITPRLLNRFYFGINRFIQGQGSVATLAGTPFSQDLVKTVTTSWQSRGICIPGYPACGYNFPQVSFGSDFTAWGAQTTGGSYNNIDEYRDDMTWIKGAHTFKWGGFYDNSLYIGIGDQSIEGNVTFSPLNTGVPGNTNMATGGGSALASFLLGQVYGYSLQTPRYIATHYRSAAGYIQDDWKVFRKLTVNLGVRVEYVLAPIVDDDQQSNFDATIPNPAAGGIKGAMLFAGTCSACTGSRTMVPKWHGYAPRSGFAYALDSKTTIRGGAGISFGPLLSSGGADHYQGEAVNVTATSTNQGISPLWTLSQGAPPWHPVPETDPAVANGASPAFWNGATATRPSNEYSFSFDIQRQLTSSLSVDAGYAGTMASGIVSSLLEFNALNYAALPANLNPFTTSGAGLLSSAIGSPAANAAGIVAPFANFSSLWGSGASVAQALRPFPQYGSIDTVAGGGDKLGHSTYNALSIRVNKRLAHGFTLQGSYNFSKYLTDADSTGPENPYNRRIEKNLSVTDQTHVAKVIYAVDLPFGKGRKYLNQNRWLDAVLGGWRLAGINVYQSGTPLALTTTINIPIFSGPDHITLPPSGYTGWRGTYTGNFDPNVNRFLQPSSFFGPQPTNQFGNATTTNPKERNFAGLNENMSLAKTFSIRERTRFELRAEAFNVLNRTIFGPVANALSLQNANFGNWASQANTPRQMQVTGKLSW